jgi:hypothetical protein
LGEYLLSEITHGKENLMGFYTSYMLKSGLKPVGFRPLSEHNQGLA